MKYRITIQGDEDLCKEIKQTILRSTKNNECQERSNKGILILIFKEMIWPTINDDLFPLSKIKFQELDGVVVHIFDESNDEFTRIRICENTYIHQRTSDWDKDTLYLCYLDERSSRISKDEVGSYFK